MDRLGKLFIVETAELRRCLCCDGIVTRQEAPNHAQVPCRPAQNAATEDECESPCMHESAR